MIALSTLTMTLFFIVGNVEQYEPKVTFIQPVQILVNISQVIKSEEKKTILFWNSYWHWKHFQMGVGNRGFQNCSFTNCYTTTRRSKLRDPHVIIHAIVFHGVDLNMKEVKNLREMRDKIPKFNQGITPLFILFIFVSILTDIDAQDQRASLYFKNFYTQICN